MNHQAFKKVASSAKKLKNGVVNFASTTILSSSGSNNKWPHTHIDHCRCSQNAYMYILKKLHMVIIELRVDIFTSKVN